MDTKPVNATPGWPRNIAVFKTRAATQEYVNA